MTHTQFGASSDRRDALITHSRITLDEAVGWYRRLHPKICFLQIGAFDGITADPIYPLVDKYDLSGILIEPQADAFQRLKANYSHLDEARFCFLNAAIGAKDGQVPLFRICADLKGPYWLHGIASLRRETVMWHAPSFPSLENSIIVEHVRCYTFKTLFCELSIPHIDILQIDAEGSDAELLSLFDIPARKPAIIHFEHRHLTEAVYLSWCDTLTALGYEVDTFEEDALAYCFEDTDK